MPAYSTLGFSADPVLSTFIDVPRPELARLIFHELAHQEFFLAGDSTFNESFATAVEEEGVVRWLASQHDARLNEQYERQSACRRVFTDLVYGARQALAAAYEAGPDDAARLAAKQRVFAGLKASYVALRADPTSVLHDFPGYDGYFARELNNADLAAFATYTKRVSAFAKLLEEQGGDLARFYAAVRELASLPQPAREARLDQLQSRAGPPR